MEEIKEQPVYEIKKVRLKDNQLAVEYEEKFTEANYTNSISKECSQIVHGDLKYALSRLKVHVVNICEMPEAKLVSVREPTDGQLENDLINIVVTGYSKGGGLDTEGVCIQAKKLLKSGQVLNISVPFTRYETEGDNGYPYGEDLRNDINRCDYEVDAYLFEEKFGFRQEQFDFDQPEESSINGQEGQKPKKRGRKPKKAEAEQEPAEEVKAFDEYA